MAEAAEIKVTQEKLGKDAAANGWSAVRIAEDLDLDMSPNTIALAYWSKQAADTAHLVDVSESGSTRSLHVIHTNAVAMAERYQRLVDKENGPDDTTDELFPRGPGIRTFPIRRIER